ncbi:NmrA-like family domain-containing protein 1-like protein 3 [Colletotrichum kahawae]|uniref:NmrA-like family domain-containing protein 1-like protein 3 n=1 Tax=Colletotrichum kahawae TaxID=34407 RepID=A0AAE0D6M3_COLKA|nr:NmrA-like family domain-containing protein 1-like protein 3 [Colletotrichum kahawae]
MATKLIAFVGASGAQGFPIARDLANSGAVPDGTIEPVIGTFASETSLRETFRGAWGAFINIDRFNCGEKTELYWSIRAYELAIEAGVKFFVFSSLVYSYKLSGFRPQFRCGHIHAKGRVAEFILGQNEEKAQGMDLDVAMSHIPYKELAAAFGKVTGKPARYVDVSVDEYFSGQAVADLPAGYNADPEDPATMSFHQNFTAEECFQREDLLGRKKALGDLWDRVQPEVIRPVLKVHDDKYQGVL